MPEPRPPYHIILLHFGFCFFFTIECVHKGGQDRDGETGGKCQKRKREGVQIKCESITYRKQFSLAQVERKLERKLAHHALEPRQRRACTRTRGCTTAHTFVPVSVRPTGNWTARKSSWVLGGDCCVMGVSLFILSVSFNSDEKLVSTRWDYRRLWLARTLPERQLNLLISDSVELRLGADWIQRCLFFFFFCQCKFEACQVLLQCKEAGEMCAHLIAATGNKTTHQNRWITSYTRIKVRKSGIIRKPFYNFRVGVCSTFSPTFQKTFTSTF